MIAKALHYKERGYKAIKMQVAHTADLATDLANVKRMREAVGPEIDIMIDVNMGWTADVAILMGRKFQDYDVYWLEEPVVPEKSAAADPAARPDARRAHRVAQDRHGRRHVGNDARAASVSGIERAASRLDPKRALDRRHGPRRRSLGRSCSGRKWIHHRAGAAGHGLAFKPEILRDCALGK
jgi:hypothetical protein